jgi:hypothetical protein
MIYALLDKTASISKHHLNAALEVWRYCDDSARFIFGDSETSLTDTIFSEISRRPDGMTKTDLRDFFHRSKKASEIDEVLFELENAGRIESKTLQTNGRPAVRWVKRPQPAGICTEVPQ